MATTALLSTAYLPPVQYFTKFLCCENILIEQCENYCKQSYRNRCMIYSCNGQLSLSIPVERTEHPKRPVRDIKIAYHSGWQKIHLRAIISAYNNSPFFKYCMDDFFPYYEKKFKFLFDYNMELLNILLRHLKIPQKIRFTEQFEANPGDTIFDFRNTIHPKIDYLSHDPFFNPQKYYQVFDTKFGFIPNLSIIDLFFNTGPDAKKILEASIIKV
ncbi:MAG: WbqC family protein [Bacteroidia bacterium]|nr:WbqC family protein [Bacteroidia bacterium]